MKLFGGKDQGENEIDGADDMELHDDGLDMAHDDGLDPGLDAGFGAEDPQPHDDAGAAASEMHDDGFDAVDDAADEIEGGDGMGGLSAPVRAASGGGGGKKGLLAGVALLVVLGLGGGYYYMTNMSGDAVPAPPHHNPKLAAKKAADPLALPPQPMPATSMSATPPAAAPSSAPLPPAVASSGAKPGNPPVNPMDLLPGGISPPSASAPVAPPMPVPDAAPAAPGMPPMPDAAAEAAAVPAMPAPDAASAPAASPAANPAPQGANPMAAAANSAAGSAAAPAASGDMPPQDLPVPADMGMAAAGAAPDTSAAASASAPTWAQPGAEVPVTKEEASKRAANALAASKPSDAEMAIMTNAAVLDQLSQPATPAQAKAAAANDAAAKAAVATNKDDKTAAAEKAPQLDKSSMKTVDQLLQQDAIIRPLPEGYVTILKSHDVGDFTSRLTQARVALSDNNNAAALDLFNGLQKDYPKDTRPIMGRAVALQKMGQIDSALAAYEDVLNMDPKNLEALTNMLGLLKNKDPQLALEKLKDLRAAYPYQPDIAAQLGVAYAQSGDYDNALKYLNMAQALAPENAYVLYNQAVLYDKMGQSGKAGDLYRQIVRMYAEGDIKDPLPIDQIKQRLIDLH